MVKVKNFLISLNLRESNVFALVLLQLGSGRHYTFKVHSLHPGVFIETR